jgi:phage FluMu protein Com
LIATCTKCRQLFQAVETEPLQPDHACPRCAAVAELLAATTELVEKTRRELGLKGLTPTKAVARFALTESLCRAESAIARARAT